MYEEMRGLKKVTLHKVIKWSRGCTGGNLGVAQDRIEGGVDRQEFIFQTRMLTTLQCSSNNWVAL